MKEKFNVKISILERLNSILHLLEREFKTFEDIFKPEPKEFLKVTNKLREGFEEFYKYLGNHSFYKPK